LAATPQVLGQSVSHEVVEGAKSWTRVAQPKVVGPASQVPVELSDQVRQWSMTLLRGYNLSQRFSFPCQRLAAGMQVPVALRSTKSISVISKGVAKKIKALAGLPQIQDASFVAIDLELQPSFQFALNPAAQLGADVAGQHDKIVRVAHEFCLGPLRRSVIPLEQVIKPVQVDVGQQWAKDASLGRASALRRTVGGVPLRGGSVSTTSLQPAGDDQMPTA
jgi:hypothetical protein